MAVEQTKRAQVLDLSRPGAVTVEIDVSEAAEVLMSICAVADRGDHDTVRPRRGVAAGTARVGARRAPRAGPRAAVRAT
jgi:hypothetical protein